MEVLVGRRVEAAWTAVTVAFVAFGLLTSEGEPVCEGVFIPWVNDSSPPQCPPPLDYVPTVATVWLVGLLAIVAARLLVRALSDRP